MKHGAVRKLIRVATLSLLALGMTSGVASVAVWSATPAMAQPGDQNEGSDGNKSGGQGGDQKPGSGGGGGDAVSQLLSGVVGGGGNRA